MILQELHAVLRLYCSNLSNLHWNSCGEEFNDTHVNITDGLIDLFHKCIDPVGEMLTRLDINPLNYIEVFKLIEGSENNYFIADSNKKYNRKEVIAIANVMLGDIVKLICASLDSEELKATINAGIKSELEAMLNDFDLQFRYLNKRKMECDEVVAAVVATHTNDESDVISAVPNEDGEESSIPMEDDAGSPENANEGICPTCGCNPCECGSALTSEMPNNDEDDDAINW